jgi:hypothetical protein
MCGRGGVRVVARVAPRVRPGFALEDKLGKAWNLLVLDDRLCHFDFLADSLN